MACRRLGASSAVLSPILVCHTPKALFSTIERAIVSAAVINSSGGTTSCTSLIRYASSASMMRPVNINSRATYDPDNFSFPHGTHLCAVEVDTETGMVTIRSYVAVDDIGKVINPLIVEGQVHGGLAQGIAQALYEEAFYDDDGNLITTTLADYLVPSAADLPSYVTDRTESPAANRLGVKGVGEAGTIASTPAVVNAIVDALRPFGVTDVAMPCTPERVWRAIQTARGGSQASAAEQHAARQSDQTQGHGPQGIEPESGDAQKTGGAA